MQINNLVLKYFKRIRSENLRENIKLNMCRNRVYTAHLKSVEPVDENKDNEIEEEELNAALERVLILLDQVNDLSKSAR